ncbi:MAG: GntR family transcriptional regulator [Planctomycetaceae bacterium]|nr:GntR family transcriptional regulator [Planctomycetaceae bacterium]
MDVQVDVSSRVPIYRQVCDQIRLAIALGKLEPNDRLPSVRELSRQIVVNPNTVARVYTELEREGVLNTRPGLGVFVAETRSDLTRKARREKLTEQLNIFLSGAVHLGLTQDEVRRAFEEQMKKFQWKG